MFPDGIPNYRTIRRDFVRAGIAVISETGERVDFHALRTTFRMFLHRHKVPLESAILLMRPSDPRLSMRGCMDTSQLALHWFSANLQGATSCEGQRDSVTI